MKALKDFNPKIIQQDMEQEKRKIDEQDALKEINTAIRDGINQWADIMLEAETRRWACRLDYFPRDIVNALIIFQHVCSTVGIKTGHIDKENALEHGKQIRQLVIDMTGYDPHNVINDLAKNTKETNDCSDSWSENEL